MYGGDVEVWGDPYANNLFYTNDQLDDEGRYISAAAPPPPPGVSPSLLYSSPNRLRKMQDLQQHIASDSPTKRGQSFSNAQPSPLRISSNNVMDASGSKIGSQKENTPIHPEDELREDVDSAPTKADTIIRLYDWYIGLQPTQQALSYYSEARGIKKWIQIYGTRYRSAENDDLNSKGKRRANDKGESWHSSLISERISSHLVKSKSGKIYELMGNFDERSSCKRKDISFDTATQFRNGFPTNWADIVCEEARSSKGQKFNSNSPSKRSQTQNNTTDESQAQPVFERESFPKTQTISQRPKPRPSVSGKQLPESKALPKERKKKSLFRNDEDSSESEYHPSSDDAGKKRKGKDASKRDGNRGRDDDDVDEDSEDSLYEEVTYKAKRNGNKGTKGNAVRRKSKDVDMVSEDEEMSNRSSSPELNAHVSSLHQMENARSRKQAQEKVQKPIRTRKSEPIPRPREMRPSNSPPPTEEIKKKAKPISRELRNLSKTAFGRLTLVQNAIMEQLEQTRSERKRAGRQSLPVIHANAPQTPIGQIGNDSNLITPRSSRRTRTPAKPWWEVQPSTKSKSKSQPKATEVQKPKLLNMNSSSFEDDDDEEEKEEEEDEEKEENEEDEEEESRGNIFAQTKPVKGPSPKRKASNNRTIIISSDDEEDEDDEYEDKSDPMTKKDAEEFIEERQIEEHVDLQSSPSHGKGSSKRVGDDIVGPAEKRSRVDGPEHLAEEQIEEERVENLEDDYQMEDDQEQSDDLHYVDEAFDQLPEQPTEENHPTSEAMGVMEDDGEQVESTSKLIDGLAANESVEDEDVDHQGDNSAQVNEAPLVKASSANRDEHEMLEDHCELADTSKKSHLTSESDRSRSSVSPSASDQNTNETTADAPDVPSPSEGNKNHSERLSSEDEKEENTQTVTTERLRDHQYPGEKDEPVAETDGMAKIEMGGLAQDQVKHKEIEVVVIEDSDDEAEDSVTVTNARDEKEEEVQTKDAQEEGEIVPEVTQQEEREISAPAPDAEEEMAVDEAIAQTVNEEAVPIQEAAATQEAVPLGSELDAEVLSQIIEVTTQKKADVSPIVGDVSMLMSEKDEGDVPSATLSVEKGSEHVEREGASISDPIHIQSNSEEQPFTEIESSKEKEAEVDLPNAETARNPTPEANHTKPAASSNPVSLTIQQEGTPINGKKYPHLSEREEQEVSVEFGALQIEAGGGNLFRGADSEYQNSFAENEKIFDNIEILDGDDITHKDPHQIVISTDKTPASISPAEDEEMDYDNESVVSLSEVYYFSD